MRTSSGQLRVVIGAALCTAQLALALPVDRVIDLAVGEEKFVKVARVDWAEVEDPSLATAEVFPTNEILLTAIRAGRTLVLLYAEGQCAVWSLRVAVKSASRAAGLKLLRTACGKDEVAELEDQRLKLHIKDEACRAAALRVLADDAWIARDLEVTSEAPVIQSQLRLIEQQLPPTIRRRTSLAYVGAGLSLSGEASAEEHRKLLWTVARSVVGALALDDQIRLVSSAQFVPPSPAPSPSPFTFTTEVP